MQFSDWLQKARKGKKKKKDRGKTESCRRFLHSCDRPKTFFFISFFHFSCKKSSRAIFEIPPHFSSQARPCLFDRLFLVGETRFVLGGVCGLLCLGSWSLACWSGGSGHSEFKPSFVFSLAVIVVSSVSSIWLPFINAVICKS